MSKTWFVTGATRGIGREIAFAALASGDNVVASGRHKKDTEEAFGDDPNLNRLMIAALDVTNAEQAEAAMSAAINRFGSIDVLVNNAGYGQLGFFETTSPEQIRANYEVNVFGTMNVTRAVLPHMRERRSGHILNISSIGGVVGFGGCPSYTSTKFAIEGFSEDMAIDLAPFGIKVTIVEPGFFRTDFLDSSSIRYGDVEVDDYAEAVADQKAEYGSHSHQQAGDPAKLGTALVGVAASDAPPLRFAAGSDAVRMTRETLVKRLAELDRWQDLSETTDREVVQARS